MIRLVVFLLFTSDLVQAFVNYKTADIELENVFDGPAAVAMGGAGLAAKSLNESAHVNPATLPLLDGSHFGFIYGAESYGQRAGSNKYHLIAAEATDDVAFPGAVSYSRIGIFKEGAESLLQEVHLGMGMNLNQTVSFGLAGKYYILETRSKSDQLSAANGTLGILVTPIKALGLAFVFDDMFATEKIPTIPTFGIGGQYIFDGALRVRLDVVQPQRNNPSRSNIFKAGMESLFLGKEINFRLGHRWDDFRNQRFFSAGLGWQGPRLGLNYAYEKSTLSEDFRHLIDMLILF